ncbi:recombinase family protein, partial [Kocuria carniphila]|uniref:recombinase family protein n=1 Tax=Kocuria carniphila TaxID=262208 RepID=UPI0013EAD798
MSTDTTNHNVIGYIRVSTKAQADHGTSLDTQREHVQAHGATKVFEDAMSGTKAERPGYQEMLAYLRPGDVVVVSYLSRLGRNARELRRAADQLQDKGVHIIA